jgi:hypothetical protein
MLINGGFIVALLGGFLALAYQWKTADEDNNVKANLIGIMAFLVLGVGAAMSWISGTNSLQEKKSSDSLVVKSENKATMRSIEASKKSDTIQMLQSMLLDTSKRISSTVYNLNFLVNQSQKLLAQNIDLSQKSSNALYDIKGISKKIDSVTDELFNYETGGKSYPLVTAAIEEISQKKFQLHFNLDKYGDYPINEIVFKANHVLGRYKAAPIESQVRDTAITNFQGRKYFPMLNYIIADVAANTQGYYIDVSWKGGKHSYKYMVEVHRIPGGASLPPVESFSVGRTSYHYHGKYYLTTEQFIKALQRDL